MTKINITLNKEEPLFSLNEHVVCFVQNSKPDEIKKSLVDWQKSLGLDEGVENKDKLQAIRSISNFLKKEEEGILKEDDINRFNKTCYGSNLKFGSINKNNKLIIHGTSQSFSKETYPIDINYKNIIIRVPTTHTDKCSIKSPDWNRFWIYN